MTEFFEFGFKVEINPVEIFFHILEHELKVKQLEISEQQLVLAEKQLKLAWIRNARDERKLELYEQRTAMDWSRFIREQIKYIYDLFTASDKDYIAFTLRSLPVSNAYGYLMHWLLIGRKLPEGWNALRLVSFANASESDMNCIIEAYLANHLVVALEVIEQGLLKAQENKIEEDKAAVSIDKLFWIYLHETIIANRKFERLPFNRINAETINLKDATYNSVLELTKLMALPHKDLEWLQLDINQWLRLVVCWVAYRRFAGKNDDLLFKAYLLHSDVELLLWQKTIGDNGSSARKILTNSDRLQIIKKFAPEIYETLFALNQRADKDGYVEFKPLIESK